MITKSPLRVWPVLLGPLALLLTLSGCDCGERSPAVLTATHVIAFAIDDQPAVSIPITFPGDEVPLASILPEGTPPMAEWREVTAEDARGQRQFSVPHPARRQDEVELVLRPQEGGV